MSSSADVSVRQGGRRAEGREKRKGGKIEGERRSWKIKTKEKKRRGQQKDGREGRRQAMAASTRATSSRGFRIWSWGVLAQLSLDAVFGHLRELQLLPLELTGDLHFPPPET